MKKKITFAIEDLKTDSGVAAGTRVVFEISLKGLAANVNHSIQKHNTMVNTIFGYGF